MELRAESVEQRGNIEVRREFAMTPDKDNIEYKPIERSVRVPPKSTAPFAIPSIKEKVKQPADFDQTAFLRQWRLRLQEAKKQGAQAGRHQGGMIPYGYKRDYDAAQKRFVLASEPHEAPIVRYIFREYLKLKSLGKLARKLTEANIRTRNDRSWSRAGLRFILDNEIYLGKIKYGTVRARGQHEPLVDLVIFQQIQKLKRAKR